MKTEEFNRLTDSYAGMPRQRIQRVIQAAKQAMKIRADAERGGVDYESVREALPAGTDTDRLVKTYSYHTDEVLADHLRAAERALKAVTPKALAASAFADYDLIGHFQHEDGRISVRMVSRGDGVTAGGQKTPSDDEEWTHVGRIDAKGRMHWRPMTDDERPPELSELAQQYMRVYGTLDPGKIREMRAARQPDPDELKKSRKRRSDSGYGSTTGAFALAYDPKSAHRPLGIR